jgi:hypothetical protein
VFNINEAFDYYDKHINRTERFEIFTERNFPIPGSVPSIDWEVFGAILTGDERKSGYGSDLKHHEVKSAGIGASYEYQYHKNHGEEKIDEDKQIDHIFIEYSPDYQNVTVRLVKSHILANTFEGWRELYKANYARGLQRFRKSISHGTVVTHGAVILMVQGGQLVQSNPNPVQNRQP